MGEAPSEGFVVLVSVQAEPCPFGERKAIESLRLDLDKDEDRQVLCHALQQFGSMLALRGISVAGQIDRPAPRTYLALEVFLDCQHHARTIRFDLLDLH